MAATPVRKSPSVLTFGLGTTDHWVPFQCSIRVRSPVAEPLVCWMPTAHTSVEEMAETALRRLPEVPFGLEMSVHLVPFQCSVRVSSMALGLLKKPTAHMSVGEMLVTPASRLFE